ncbi:MAG: hypothetical protein ABEH88_07175, partial [Halobacteriales archaeon]
MAIQPVSALHITSTDTVNDPSGDLVPATTQDTDPPVIHNFTVLNETVEPGDQLAVRVNVSDQSNISWISAEFRNDSFGQEIYLYGDEDQFNGSGVYTISRQVSEDAINGTYSFDNIEVGDEFGFQNYTDSDELGQQNLSVDVLSNNTDTDPPVINLESNFHNITPQVQAQRR